MILFFLVCVSVLALIALVFAINSLFRMVTDRVPYVPSSMWAARWLAENLELPANAVIYDLGCGDGRMLVALKKKFPTIRAIGYERSWWPLLLAWFRARPHGVELRAQSFYAADLSDADFVFCFLIDSVMPKLEKKLQAQLRPGICVASYGFTFPTWKPERIIPNPNPKRKSGLYLYRA